MGFFDKVGSFLKREAKDLGDAAESVKDKLDTELTRREDELKMTPSEKIAALQQQAASNDAKLDAIADKVGGRGAIADAVAEVGELPASNAPTITHIVLPDGRVRSGNDNPRQSSDGNASASAPPTVEAPAVEAPTGDDIEAPAVEPGARVPESDDVSAEPDPESSTDESVDTNTVDAVPDSTIDEPAPATEPEDELPPPPNIDEAAPVGEPEDELPPPPNIDEAAPVGEPEDELPPPPAAARTSVEATPASDAIEFAEELASDREGEPLQNPSSRDYAKTPAQIKYEQARAAANDLLDELRGELEDDGDI